MIYCCPECGSPDLFVIAGTFTARGMALMPDGFAFVDAKGVDTSDEIVACDECDHEAELSLFEFSDDELLTFYRVGYDSETLERFRAISDDVACKLFSVWALDELLRNAKLFRDDGENDLILIGGVSDGELWRTKA